MTWLRRSIHKLRNFIRPAEGDNEFNREVASHLLLLQDEFIRKGMSASDAVWAAKRAYGSVGQARQLQWEERSWVWLEQLRQDVRFSTRALLKCPWFSLTAVLTLALGIGANTAIFSLIDGLMLRPLPVRQPEQLVQVTMGQSPHTSNPIWEELRNRQNVFSAMFAFGNKRFNLAPGGEARYVQGSFASGGFFDTLGLGALIGRTFTNADDHRGCRGTAVLSYDFWQSEYSGHTGVVGKTILLDNHPFEILGVLKPGFTGIDVGSRRDLYVPLCTEKLIRGKTSRLDRSFASWLRLVGRLKQDVSFSQAETRLRALAPEVFKAALGPSLDSAAQEHKQNITFDAELAANGLSFVRGQYRNALTVLMMIVGVVLLIACANLANLLLARGAARQHEIAIRLALGSGRARLLSQLLIESLMLSMTGALLGILFAQWGARSLVRLLSSNVYNDHTVFVDLSIDFRMLSFTAVLAILSALLFGLAAAWKGTRLSPQVAMKANPCRVTKGGGFGMAKSLVVVQVALSLVLVVAAGLMLSTLLRLETLDPGFEREHVLLMNVDLQNGHYQPRQCAEIFGEILERLRALRGLRSVSYSAATPIDGSLSATNIRIVGGASTRNESTGVYLNQVSGQYFETMGTGLMAGRDFGAHDTLNSPRVAIVNQTLAESLFAGQNPLGRRYLTDGANVADVTEIIGVVKDAKYIDLREKVHPTAYTAASQDPTPGESTTFELRVRGRVPAAVISDVKAAIAEVNSSASLEFKTMVLQVDESLVREHLLATLSGFFGVLALVLATIGLYGLVSYNVATRRNEIGIRMAIGAQPSHVLRMVLGEVATLIAIGLALGVATALATTRFVAGFLYGMKPNDAWTFSLAAAVLAAVALLAGFLPALRASRMDPMNSLREE